MNEENNLKSCPICVEPFKDLNGKPTKPVEPKFSFDKNKQFDPSEDLYLIDGCDDCGIFYITRLAVDKLLEHPYCIDKFDPVYHSKLRSKVKELDRKSKKSNEDLINFPITPKILEEVFGY